MFQTNIYDPYTNKDKYDITAYNNTNTNGSLLIIYYDDLSANNVRKIFNEKKNLYDKIIVIYNILYNIYNENEIMSIGRFFFETINIDIIKVNNVEYSEEFKSKNYTILSKDKNRVIYNHTEKKILYYYNVDKNNNIILENINDAKLSKLCLEYDNHVKERDACNSNSGKGEKEKEKNIDANIQKDLNNEIKIDNTTNTGNKKDICNESKEKNILIVEPFAWISLFFAEKFKTAKISCLEEGDDEEIIDHITKNLSGIEKILSDNIIEYLNQTKKYYDLFIFDQKLHQSDKTIIDSDKLKIIEQYLTDNGKVFIIVNVDNNYEFDNISTIISKYFNIYSIEITNPCEYMFFCSKIKAI